jgi:EpsI family protein
MIARRDLLIGSACVVAAGVAYALQPRRHLSLLGQQRLDRIVPPAFGKWTSREAGDLVSAQTDDSLAAELYDQMLERRYRHAVSETEIMVLMAHGEVQSNELQIHRPETCYPAFGFVLSNDRKIQLQLPGGSAIPARSLVADAPGRRETVIYWTRLGEFLPTDGSEQRTDRVRAALGGYVADGLLARFSVLGATVETSFAAIVGFIPELLKAVSPEQLPALIGNSLATSIAARET